MAYKFQIGQAILSGSLQQEGNVVVENEGGETVGHILQSGIVSGSGQLQGASVAVDGAVTAGSSFIIGSADLNEVDMEKLDGITDGTAAANKAVVLDASSNVTGINILTASYFSGDGSSLTNLPLESISAAGSDQDIQFNQNGAFAAAENLHYDGTGSLDLVNHDGSSEGLKLGGTLVTATAAELNLLDGVTATTNELNILDGVTATAAEINYLDIASLGTGVGSKALVFDAAGTFDGVTNNLILSASIMSASNFYGDGSGLTNISSDTVDTTTQSSNAVYYVPFVDQATGQNGETLYIQDSLQVNPSSDAVQALGSFQAASLTADDLTASRLVVAGTSGILEDHAELVYDENRSEGYLELILSSSASGSAQLRDGGFIVRDNSSATMFMVDDQGISLNKVSDEAIDLAADSVYFLDADGFVKRDTFADYATAIAGEGIAASSGQLSLDLNELTAEVIASGDFLAFVDSTDNGTHKETVDDLASLFAGTGLAAASAVLSLDLNELSAAAVDVANDSIAIIDADDSNGSRKESVADLVSAMAGAGLTATNGVLSTQAGVVTLVADSDSLVEGYNYLADLVADATVTLPSGPSVGDVVHVKAADVGANNVIINVTGSHSIDDDHTSIRIESDFGAVSLVYVATNKWRIV